MNCPKCQTEDGNTVKTERHRTGRILACLLAIGLLTGPCIDNSAWLRIGQQPVIQKPVPTPA